MHTKTFKYKVPPPNLMPYDLQLIYALSTDYITLQMVIKGHYTLTPVTQWGMENIPIDIRVFSRNSEVGERSIKRHAMGLTNILIRINLRD